MQQLDTHKTGGINRQVRETLKICEQSRRNMDEAMNSPLILSLANGLLNTSSAGLTRCFPYKHRSTHQLVTKFSVDAARLGRDDKSTSAS